MAPRNNIRITLAPCESRQFDGYGLVFEGNTYHRLQFGSRKRGPFQVKVFENRTSWADGEPTGQIVDAHGKPTKETYSYLLSEQSVMIASTPVDTPPYGDDIKMGDIVQLYIYNYRLGTFLVDAGVGVYDVQLTKVSH